MHIKVEVEKGWEPDNWRIVYGNIRKMREDKSAICDRKYRYKKKYSKKEKRFHVLIGLMLSSRTQAHSIQNTLKI